MSRRSCGKDQPKRLLSPIGIEGKAAICGKLLRGIADITGNELHDNGHLFRKRQPIALRVDIHQPQVHSHEWCLHLQTAALAGGFHREAVVELACERIEGVLILARKCLRVAPYVAFWIGFGGTSTCFRIRGG